MTNSSAIDKAELLRELLSTQCKCGNKKKARQTFCGRCFYSLSKENQHALYLRIGEGYEEAYSGAIERLTSIGRIKNG